MNVSKIKLGITMAKKGYNFKLLALKSGVSRATLSAINNGKSCKADVLVKISDALGCQSESLLE